MFVIGHAPQAKPVRNDEKKSIVGLTEPTAWRIDRKSAYRGWLFPTTVWVNFLIVCLFIVNTIGVICTAGWGSTSAVVRILICLCFAPLIMGAFDALARSDARCLWGLIVSAPAALPLMTWYTIWLPIYETTRLSDLTWGNQEGIGLEESSRAINRAKDGRRVAQLLIGFNIVVSVTVIFLMQHFEQAFPLFAFIFLSILSITFVIALADLIYRFLTCQYWLNSTYVDPVIDEAEGDPGFCHSCQEDYVEEGDGIMQLKERIGKMEGDGLSRLKARLSQIDLQASDSWEEDGYMRMGANSITSSKKEGVSLI